MLLSATPGWAFSIGGSTPAANMDVNVDAQGDVYVTATYKGTIDLDPGPGTFFVTPVDDGIDDVFLAKNTAEKQLVWAARIGGADGGERGIDIEFDALDNVYISGYSSSSTLRFADAPLNQTAFTLTNERDAANTANWDAYVAKLDPNGNFLWAHNFGNVENGFARQMTVNDAGDVLLAGSFRGQVDFDPDPDNEFVLASAGESDAVVWKLDTDGQFQWARSFGGSADDGATRLSTDAVGDIYVTGEFQETVNFGTTAAPINLTSTTPGLDDAYLMKLDSAGDTVWVNQISGAGSVGFSRLTISPDGSIYSGGSFDGAAIFDAAGTTLTSTAELDVYIAKWESGGALLWVKQFESTGNGVIGRMLADEDNNVFIAARFKGGTADVDPDATGAFILTAPDAEWDGAQVQLDESGNFVTAYTATGPDAVRPLGVALDEAGNIYAIGSFRDSVTLPTGDVLTSPLGLRDTYVMKLEVGTNPVNDHARQESTVNGSVTSGAFRDTRVSDNVYEAITEEAYAGGKRSRAQHQWTFDVAGGATVTFFVEAHHNSTVEDFAFEYSTDGSTWTPMLTVTKTVDDGVAQSFDLPNTISGTLLVRVIDTDRSRNEKSLDTVFIDDMFIRSAGASLPTLSIDDVSVTEGDGGTTTALFTVTRSGDSSQTVTVDYSTQDGSATSPSDYGAIATTTLTFNPGEVAKTVSVTVNGDTVSEGDETFFVNLSGAVGATITDNQGVGTILNDDVPPPSATKFFVVDNSADDTFQYDDAGNLVTNSNLAPANTNARGAAASTDGSTIWVVDNNDTIYVYDGAGGLQNSWTAGGLNRAEGIATDETDIWILDGKSKKVLRYDGAAGSGASGIVNPASSFALDGANSKAKGITTDGAHLWVVNDGRNVDRVFKYTTAGTLVGSWTIDSSNSKPTGVTIDPSGSTNSVWIVDSGADRVFEYTDGRNDAGGSLAGSFALAAANTNPQGIADPLANNASSDVDGSATLAFSAAEFPMFASFSTSDPKASTRAANTDIPFVLIGANQ